MKFQRNTHNPDGTWRFTPEHVFKHWTCFQSREHPNCGRMWVLHLLDPHKGMTLDEVIESAHKYNKDFHEELDPPAEIALGLIRLVEDDMVKVVE